MKKYVFAILIVIYAFQLSAQSDAFNFKLSSKGHRRIIPYVHPNGTLHYVFVNKASLEIHWLDANQSRTLVVPLEKQFKKSKLLTSIASVDSLHVYFWDVKTRKIEALVVNKASKNFAYKEIITLNNNEELFKYIKDKESLHILTLNASNTLKVITLNHSKIAITKEYAIPFQSFYKAIFDNTQHVTQDVLSQIGITTISHDVANNLRSTVHFEKMYFLNNVIYFTLDEATTTHLIRILLSEQVCDYKKLNFKLERTSNTNKGNSFLINNRLLRITANQSQVNICAVDLDSFKLVKNYNFYPENDDFEIKNSQIITENNDVADSEFLSTRDFFKNIMEGDIGIAANIVENGNYELLIGSEEEIISQRNNFGPSLMGGNMPISFGIGIGNGIGGPGFGYPGSMATTSYTLTTSFKALVNPLDFSHIKGSTSKNIIDKIHDFEDRAFGNNSPEIYTVYRNKNKVQYGYVTKWNNTFYVVEF